MTKTCSRFLSILCGIIQEVDAPENIIELAARAITYFLDVDVNCGTSIVGCKSEFNNAHFRVIIHILWFRPRWTNCSEDVCPYS